MARPSHFTVPLTVCGVAIYLLLQPPQVESPAPADDGPVVVRRTGAGLPAPTAMLSGRLLNRLGWPVERAEIALADGGPPVTTDEQGAFELPVPAVRRQLVRIEAPRYEPVVCALDPDESRVLVLRDALPWSPPLARPPVEPPGQLAGEGFAKDETGHSVPGAVVVVAETGARYTADTNGQFRIPLPDGPATLVAWDGNGRVGRLEALESPRKTGLVPLPDIVLTKGETLRGYLADSEGQPTRGAALTLHGPGFERQLVTDDSGAFAFRGLLPGDYELEALPHRGSLGFRRPVTMDREEVDLELALTRPRPLDVKVVAQTGPVADVWVLAEERELRRSHSRTDADGKAVLDGLGEGPFDFEVRDADGLEPVEVVDYDPQASELRVRVP